MFIIKNKRAQRAANTTWARTRKAIEILLLERGKDYSSHYKGWPDIVSLNKKTGTFYFIECKRLNEYHPKVSLVLSPEQNEVRKMLNRITKKPMQYEIWFYENKKGSKKIVKKCFCDGNNLVPFSENN